MIAIAAAAVGLCVLIYWLFFWVQWATDGSEWRIPFGMCMAYGGAFLIVIAVVHFL